MPLETLRSLTADVVSLRRGDHHAMRLEIERERLEMDRRTKTETGLEEIAEQIKANPEAITALKALEKAMNVERKNLTEEERAARIREIFGVAAPGKRGLSPETLQEIERAMGLL